MAELRMRIFGNIGFNLIPIAFVIAHFLALCADGQHSMQGFDFRQCESEFFNQQFALLLGGFAAGDTRHVVPG